MSSENIFTNFYSFKDSVWNSCNKTRRVIYCFINFGINPCWNLINSAESMKKFFRSNLSYDMCFEHEWQGNSLKRCLIPSRCCSIYQQTNFLSRPRRLPYVFHVLGDSKPNLFGWRRGNKATKLIGWFFFGSKVEKIRIFSLLK